MSESLTVHFAGSTVKFEVPGREEADLLRDRFQGFSTDPSGDTQPFMRLLWRIKQGPEFHFDFDRKTGRGLLECSGVIGNIDVAVRQLLPHLIDGAAFHSALLIDHGRSYLCCGASGAGKSTLCSLLPDYAQSDELSAVIAGGTGHALPFWNARAGTAPLAGVFLLSHAAAHCRTRLDSASAFREISHHVLWPRDDEHAIKRCLETVSAIVRDVPVWRLGFRPDPGVWALISEPA